MPKRKASEMEKPGFTVQCPVKPKAGAAAAARGKPGALPPPRPESRKRGQDVFVASDTPGPAELQIDYKIKPAREWNEMRKYRNVKYQDKDFPVDSYILVNHTYPPPSPPPADASLEQLLNYQRTHTWVGKIREARAQDEHRVFLRVFWLYWPEELPGGPEAYHGQQELVLSNHVEVVEATTISGPAQVSHWDENDEEDETPLYPLFWRQTLDLKPGPNGKPTLSALRKHCVCKREYNPDKTMFKCGKESCGIWNHKECLEKDLEDSLKLKLRKKTLHSHLDRRAAELSQEQKDKEKEEEAPKGDGNGIVAWLPKAEATDETGLLLLSSSSSSPPPPPQPTLPLNTAKGNTPPPRHNAKQDRLQVSVQDFQGKTRGTVVAQVKLTPAMGSTAEVKEWTIPMSCLKCCQPLE